MTKYKEMVKLRVKHIK